MSDESPAYHASLTLELEFLELSAGTSNMAASKSAWNWGSFLESVPYIHVYGSFLTVSEAFQL